MIRRARTPAIVPPVIELTGALLPIGGALVTFAEWVTPGLRTVVPFQARLALALGLALAGLVVSLITLRTRRQRAAGQWLPLAGLIGSAAILVLAAPGVRNAYATSRSIALVVRSPRGNPAPEGVSLRLLNLDGRDVARTGLAVTDSDGIAIVDTRGSLGKPATIELTFAERGCTRTVRAREVLETAHEGSLDDPYPVVFDCLP